MTKQTIDFKDPVWIKMCLRTALKKEKEKYEKCPVKEDLSKEYMAVNGWGYVIAGYFLVEQSFKAVLYFREKKAPKIHSLTDLFELFEEADKEILREYYNDYRATISRTINAFPYETLDGFLVNLDGENNRGSFEWRYFPIEKQGPKMPVICIEYLYEIVLGCIEIIAYVHNEQSKPNKNTHSWRLRRERYKKYNDWLIVRLNSPEWDDAKRRLEILWGPDYLGRYDLIFFGEGRLSHGFCKVPDDFELSIVDKRNEIAAFDVEEG